MFHGLQFPALWAAPGGLHHEKGAANAAGQFYLEFESRSVSRPEPLRAR